MDVGREPEREGAVGRSAGWYTPSSTGGTSGGLGGGWESRSDAWRDALWLGWFGGDAELLWLGRLHWEMKERTESAGLAVCGCFQSDSRENQEGKC
jgi:hypothetical protein